MSSTASSGPSGLPGSPHSSTAANLYAGLLRAHPSGFRRRFGPGMRYAFGALHVAARRRGPLHLAGFWLRNSAHALWFGLAERLRRPRRSSSPIRTPLSPKPDDRPGVAAMLREFLSEIRLAARRLAHAPGFSLAAVGTLALGIGATSAIFSVVNAVVINPLPYPDADRLVWIWHTAPGANIDYIFVRPRQARVVATELVDLNLSWGQLDAQVAGIHQVVGDQPVQPHRERVLGSLDGGGKNHGRAHLDQTGHAANRSATSTAAVPTAGHRQDPPVP